MADLDRVEVDAVYIPSDSNILVVRPGMRPLLVIVNDAAAAADPAAGNPDAEGLEAESTGVDIEYSAPPFRRRVRRPRPHPIFFHVPDVELLVDARFIDFESRDLVNVGEGEPVTSVDEAEAASQDD